MALNSASQDELDLRKRSRRRLVGAIALALLAIVVLPMIFDPEPKPLGSSVDIHIPDQAASPLATTTGGANPAAAPQTSLPVTVPVPQSASATPPTPKGETIPNLESGAKPAEPTKKPPAQSNLMEAPKPRAMPRSDPAELAPAAPRGVSAGKAIEQGKPVHAKGSNGDMKPYYLQLGSFANEANASQLIDKASKAGFKSMSIRIDGQIKVRVGPIADREQALDYQGKLKSKGFTPVLVGP